MRFATDKQTFEDLNIFGKNGSDTIYTLFNRTCTRGGAAMLEEWFRYPLADHELINQRNGIILYFSNSGMSFPFRIESFDEAEQYLRNEDERSRLVAGDQTLASRMTSMIAEDSAYKTIYKGVTALTEILQHTAKFISSVDPEAGIAYCSERQTIKDLLAEQALLPLLREVQKGKWPFSKIAEGDNILRFRHREWIHKLLRLLYQLDVYLSVAKLAKERGFAFAEALPRDRQYVRIEGVYHPQIKNAVANDIEIDSKSNLIFLTGANMAGKSTFMKSVGIALLLAHTGLPVPASRMVFSVREGIYTTINLPDDLGMGASHFYAEVLRVKKIAKELGQSKSLFVIFDELFRGTNVNDANEATVALCGAFAKRRNSMFIISTHIIEAGDELRAQIGNINFLCLPTRMDHHQPVYTYTLGPGISSDRHGMLIIRNEGILDILQKGTR